MAHRKHSELPPAFGDSGVQVVIPRAPRLGLRDAFVQGWVVISVMSMGAVVLHSLLWPRYSPVAPGFAIPSVVSQIVYPASVRDLPPPATALAHARTDRTQLSQSPLEIVDLPRPGPAFDPQSSTLKIPSESPDHNGLSEWTSRAVRVVQPVGATTRKTGNSQSSSGIPALTPAGLIVPNTYDGGASQEPEAVIIADSLPVYVDPRSDSTVAGPALTYLQKVMPEARIRSESDFDWLRIPASDTHPNGGWVAAEYVAPAASVAALPTPGSSYALGEEPVDRERALPNEYRPHDLVQLPTSIVFAGKEVFVREPTAAALEALVAKARSENIQLRVLSGFRPFDHQRKLYFDALAQRGPKQNGTALPGHSEHQLGTTVDFCGLNIRAHLNGSFASTPEGQFLQREASNFGFRNSYTAENSEESGFKPEPWHWRHIQDVRGVQVP